jgi:hypothetical protein
LEAELHATLWNVRGNMTLMRRLWKRRVPDSIEISPSRLSNAVRK